MKTMMSPKHQLLLDYNHAADVALLTLSASGLTYLTADKIWQILIYELELWDVPSQVLWERLDAGGICEIVRAYDRKYHVAAGSVVFAAQEIGSGDELEKARIHYKGEILEIHKTDTDPYPSDPHAHNYQQHYKVHLGSGKFYRKKEIVGGLRPKELVQLRELIRQKIKNIALPPIGE